jgi:hypothetical protein
MRQASEQRNAEVDLEHAAHVLRRGLRDMGMQECRLGGGEKNPCGGVFWSNLSSDESAREGTLLLIVPGSGSSDPGVWSTLTFCSQVGCEKGSG